MVRAAAKNHANVAVVVSPQRYADVIAAVEAGGFTLEQRRSLAAEAFAHTATYDIAVASWVGNVLAATDAGSGFPAWVGARGIALRCCGTARTRTSGRRSMARRTYPSRARAGRAAARQGDVVQQLRRRRCRTASRVRLRRAMRRDHQARQPVRHRGRATTSPRHMHEGPRHRPRLRVRRRDRRRTAPVTAAMAAQVAEVFTEVVVAPEFEDDALEILTTRKNLRLLRCAAPPRAGRRRMPAASAAACSCRPGRARRPRRRPGRLDSWPRGEPADEVTLARPGVRLAGLPRCASPTRSCSLAAGRQSASAWAR